MPACALLLAAAAAPAAVSSGALRQLRGALNATGPQRRAALRISDCTPSGSPVTNIRWTAPSSLNPGEVADIKLTGDIADSSAAPTYSLTVTYLGLPVLNHGSSGCGTDQITLPLDMGRVDMTLLSCPVSPGPIAIDAKMTIALIPPGTVINDIKAFDDDGKEVICIKAEVLG